MKREKGNGTVTLTLSNGELIAYNENTLRGYHRRKIYHGEWNELWDFITKKRKAKK